VRTLLRNGVLAAEGVPMSKTPSDPTDATTLPELVEKTSRFGVISVTPTFSRTTGEAEDSAKTRNASIRIVAE